MAVQFQVKLQSLRARERLRGRTLFKKVDACQHNICPNLSAPAPGKTAPPGQGKDDSVNCRQTLFRNIPKLQQNFDLFSSIFTKLLQEV